MQVALFGSIREIVGLATMDVPVGEGDTVRDVIEKLFEAAPTVRDSIVEDADRLRDFVSIFLQGRNIRLLQGLDTRVQEGSRLAIFPPVAGGV